MMITQGRVRPPGLRRAEVASATQAGAPFGHRHADGPAVRPYHSLP
jgi:hypothetical protein